MPQATFFSSKASSKDIKSFNADDVRLGDEIIIKMVVTGFDITSGKKTEFTSLSETGRVYHISPNDIHGVEQRPIKQGDQVQFKPDSDFVRNPYWDKYWDTVFTVLFIDDDAAWLKSPDSKRVIGDVAEIRRV